MSKRLKFPKPRPDQALNMAASVTGGDRGLVPAPPPSGSDLAQRAARAWEMIAARRPELREFDPGIPPWAAVELVRDAAECGDLPDALRALRWAAAGWLAALAPTAEWSGNPTRGLAHVRYDCSVLLAFVRDARMLLAAAETVRVNIRRATHDVRADIERAPDHYRDLPWARAANRLASDWAVWCRHARCALVWLHAAEGSAPPPDDHFLPEEQCP